MFGKCDLPTLSDENWFYKFMTFLSQCKRNVLHNIKLDAYRNLLILKSMQLSSKCDENAIFERKREEVEIKIVSICNTPHLLSEKNYEIKLV